MRWRRKIPCWHRLADYRPYDGTQVLRKEPGALYVHYPVNRSYLDTLYRTNNETLDKIVELTARVSADSAAEVRFIEIIGLASPEGPLAFNIRLAQRRAEALARYIQERTGYPDSLFRLISGGPAWTELRDYVADTDSANEFRDGLLQVIDSIPDPVMRESAMRRLRGTGLTAISVGKPCPSCVTPVTCASITTMHPTVWQSSSTGP